MPDKDWIILVESMKIGQLLDHITGVIDSGGCDMPCEVCPFNNYGPRRSQLISKYSPSGSGCGIRLLKVAYSEIVANRKVSTSEVGH